MAIQKSRRIGIWIIAITMIIGTLGSFIAMILSNKNMQSDLQSQNDAYAEYQKEIEEQEAEAKKYSKKYFSVFKRYKNSPSEFDKNKVDEKKVVKKDLRTGSGEVINKDTKYKAYYIGWNPRGKTFDSSFNDDNKSLNAPLNTSEITLIKGWDEGVVGMKVGGVREITIPSDLAYGEQGAGDEIPPNTPIKFIVMVIEVVK